mgnify:FL=1|jgi:hypothetical protein|tara:strand:+ start:1561 stop:1776 length:216 start_codon:yes stop_codon:yes gene_type:complete
MDDDYLYEKNFDENVPYISIDLGVEDVRQIHESVNLHLDNWVSCPEKKERLEEIKDFLNRLLLEYAFKVGK